MPSKNKNLHPSKECRFFYAYTVGMTKISMVIRKHSEKSLKNIRNF